MKPAACALEIGSSETTQYLRSSTPERSGSPDSVSPHPLPPAFPKRYVLFETARWDKFGGRNKHNAGGMPSIQRGTSRTGQRKNEKEQPLNGRVQGNVQNSPGSRRYQATNRCDFARTASSTLIADR